MTRRFHLAASILVGVAVLTGVARGADTVIESARDIPIAARADVVVVGGTTGAVVAAIAAAEQGAKVFLAAPFPYLGEDMTATLRLWLEPGEKPQLPLARLVFDDPSRELVDPGRLSFSYRADHPSAKPHSDTTPPSRLTDGKCSSASQQSVQFDDDVTIIADLGKPQNVSKIRVTFYRRHNSAGSDTIGSGFDIKEMRVAVSDDGDTWKPIGDVQADAIAQDIARVSLPTDVKSRYFKIALVRPEGYARMLLGEVEILRRPEADTPQATVSFPPRPMHVKKTLDDALIRAGVQYLYSCYATDVLRDKSGNIAGVVMANRAGRQAVLAKTVIDATFRATVARMAGASFRPYPTGLHTFRRVVVGGKPHPQSGVQVREPAPPYVGVLANPADSATNQYAVLEYTLTLPMDGADYGNYMRADQIARTLTYDETQQFTSDVLFEIPPDPMHGKVTADGPWKGAQALPLAALNPKQTDRLWVLGGCADVARPLAEQLLRPLALMELGSRVGRAAAAKAAQVGELNGVHLGAAYGITAGASAPSEPAVAGVDVRENLTGIRPEPAATTIHQVARPIPVLGHYDVAVVGGGTGGAPAGIGAARRDAKTLVVEYLYGLGGVGTEGAISSYYWGNRIGFTASVLDGATKWPIEPKKEWYRQQVLKAGGELWFGTLGCGAAVKGHDVVGVVVATPYGRGVVLAKTVVDSTGNSDVAVAAGAAPMYTDATEFGMQGTGLPGRRLGGSYNNTDFTIVDETDLLDMWRMFVFSKEKYADAFDHGRLIDTRERRRIVGDFAISILDEINERTYPDTVVQTYSNFDTHGYTIDPYFLIEHPEKRGVYVNVPFRAMLPKGLEGIIVTGLSISAQRDAIPLIRMQADIQNGGYAAGVAAAMAGYVGVPVRHIDVKRLQEHLVKLGNLPETVLTDKDSYPIAATRLAEAVRTLPGGTGASVIMVEPQRSIPLLRKALAAAKPEDRLVYAKALAVLGQDDGLAELIAAVDQAAEWDKGWNYKGMGQFGAALSPLDDLIVCLGRAKNPKALPTILAKMKLLDARSEFSHHRAVGLALELLHDPRAAKPLAELLQKPDMTGHVQNDIEQVKQQGVPGGTNAEKPRRESLRELLLARALYRCGDYQGVGEKILQNYTHDLRGHLARHALAVLNEKP